MILATIDTGSYLWSVLVEDKADAPELLARAYARFCQRTTGADPGYMRHLIDAGEVNYTEIQPGVVLCDSSAVFGDGDCQGA